MKSGSRRRNGNYCTDWGLKTPHEKLIGIHRLGQVVHKIEKRNYKMEGGSEQHTQRLWGAAENFGQ